MDTIETIDETTTDLTLGQEIAKEALTAAAISAAGIVTFFAVTYAAGKISSLVAARKAKKNQQEND